MSGKRNEEGIEQGFNEKGQLVQFVSPVADDESTSLSVRDVPVVVDMVKSLSTRGGPLAERIPEKLCCKPGCESCAYGCEHTVCLPVSKSKIFLLSLLELIG